MTVQATTVRSFGVSLLLIIVAILCFLLAAFGVGSKLGIDIVDLGLAFFAASFIFG
jgi:hypothetical protein